MAEVRPLYRAMKKYGVENFSISLIEECEDDVVNEREIYWIGYYHSYTEGYNATLGGEGKCLFNHNAIANRLKEYPYPKYVAKEFGCSADTVCDVAHSYGIKIKNAGRDGIAENSAMNLKKTISAFTKDNKFVKSFESTGSRHLVRKK